MKLVSVLYTPVLSRRSLLSQVEAKYEEEKMLMNSSVTTVNGQRREPSSASDDLVIHIEVGPGHDISSLPILEEEESDASGSPVAEREPYVTVKSKLHTKQAAPTQNFELEVSV